MFCVLKSSPGIFFSEDLINSSIFAFSSVLGINISTVRWERLNGSDCNTEEVKVKVNSNFIIVHSNYIKLTLSLNKCLWITGRSIVIFEEGKMTGSFISVYCNQKKENDENNEVKGIWTKLLQSDLNKELLTWIGSRNSSGISPRAASASIASDAATLAFSPRSTNSRMILASSPILLRTSAAAANN